MLAEQGPQPIHLDPKGTADSLMLYIYYNQLQ